jgi:hypothetical protein
MGAGEQQPDLDTSMASHPGFDLEYMYISGGIADGDQPCTSCASGCSATVWDWNTSQAVTQSCANSAGGCAWWGCWQWDQDPPATKYGSYFASQAAGRSRIPMYTYYILLQAYRQVDHTLVEGTPEVTVAARSATFMHRYLGDFRLLLQRIGSYPALVHIEPDFWGYAQQSGSDPHALAAAVATANATDCGGQENSIAGLGRCMIAMVRKYAPNAKVGLHASAWATGVDVTQNQSASFDVAAEGAKVGGFLAACGAGQADVVIADIADRDAADGGHWLNTDSTLPSILQVLQFDQAVSQAAGKPIVWWQVPVGNMSLNDTANHYRDNRLDWFFDHPDLLAQYGAVGAAFGGGQGSSTTPFTDGGHLFSRVAAYATAGGQKLCK